jgi:MFS family permease
VSPAKAERRWSALALIVTAQFMVILDVAIVNVALPSIKTDLRLLGANLQWVISAYAIMFGGVLLLGGRWPTCSGAGGSSSPASRSSRRARCSAGSPGRRSH